MTSATLFQILRDNRAVLLTCEAVGWLHMAGKAHPNFVRQAAGQQNQWSMRKALLAPALSQQRQDLWNVLLSSGLPLPVDIELLLSGFMGVKVQGNHVPQPNLLGLLQAGHGASSGIEKNSPGKYQKQGLNHVYLTTPFGHPIRNLLVTPPWVLDSNSWPLLESRIADLLNRLLAASTNSSAWSGFKAWRDSSVGPNGWLREAFTQTCAETRIPNNDVTLWDQSYIAAALFKPAVAGALLEGQSFVWGNNIKDTTRWRVLTVGIGAEHYEGRALRIGDWTGTRHEIQAFLDDISDLLELDLAVGACVYRDERCISLTFPHLQSFDEGQVAELVRSIATTVDERAKQQKFETPPRVSLSLPSESLISMARELDLARRRLEIPVHRPWSLHSDGGSGQHVCPVSLVRMQAQGSTSKEEPSEICSQRRNGRHKFWRQEGGDTIWITEVADDNDRVALLTFSFDLDSWLDGLHVDSLRTQSVMVWRNETPQLKSQPNPIDPAAAHSSMLGHIRAFLTQPGRDVNNCFRDLVLDDLIFEFSKKDSLASLFDQLVADRSSQAAPAWTDVAADPGIATSWFSHQLFRKNASPGRVHRFWRTTQTFFKEALAEFRLLVRSTDHPLRTQRLKLVLSGDVANLRRGEVYAGHLPFARTAPFEILHRGSDFVTVCNLARVLRVDDDASRLRGVAFEAKGDDGKCHNFTVDQVDTAGEPLSTFNPLIVLEENPERFRVLVPLTSAEACVEHVVNKWKNEMARVWDRLPLRFGLVAFPRKTPFQAVIEATRNIEDDLASGESDPWRVDQTQTINGATSICFVRPDGSHELVDMPTALPDGRDDVYYPNLAVDGTVREPHDFAAPRRNGASTTFRWAPELKPGDNVTVAPARFSRVFLDTTARRFEPIRVWPLSDWNQQREIWRIVTESARSLTAARGVEQSLREAREHWTGPDGTLDAATWLTWVRAVLANEWTARGAQLETLVAAAPSGLLEHVLTWNLHVLKRNDWRR